MLKKQGQYRWQILIIDNQPYLIMKKNMTMVLTCLVMIGCMLSCTKTGQKTVQCTSEEKKTADVAQVLEGMDVPPVTAVVVKGLPLFAPFNEGDLFDGGKALRETPEKYNKFIVNGQCFDVSYKEEKNKQLKNDTSYFNQYFYQMEDGMKGQLYTFADAKAVEEYMQNNGEVTPEGDVIVQEYMEGIMVPGGYLKGRTLLKSISTTTEDPNEPQFDASIVAQVEKAVGAKVAKNRISSIFGDDEYQFGIMKTQPKDQKFIAAWVLAKGDEICLHTDTCTVEEGQEELPDYDLDDYMEPIVLSVVKGKNGIDLFCVHSANDEQINYLLMRQEGRKMNRYDLGGFYQMYE